MNSQDKTPPVASIFFQTLSLFLKRNSLFENEYGDRQTFVGVSGGADSICLLHTLVMVPAIKNSLTILHFNHQTDQDRNQIEETFVSNQAISLNIHFIGGKRALNTRTLSEDRLREERYRFFNHHLDGAPRSILFLGHHLSDQSETILMNLFRNRGLRGLMGMQEFRDGRYARPFLSLTSSVIRKELQEQNIPYLQDPSNEDSRYLRNRVRNELSPLIKEIFPPRGIESLPLLAEQMEREIRPEIQNSQRLLDEQSQGILIMSLSLFQFLSPVRQSMLIERLLKYQSQWGLPIPPPGNILRSLNRKPPMIGPMGEGWSLSIESGKIRLYHSTIGEDLDESLSPFFQLGTLDTKKNMEQNVILPKGGVLHLAMKPIEEDSSPWETGMKTSRQCILLEDELPGLVFGYPFRGARIKMGSSGKPSKNLNRELLKSRLCRRDRIRVPVLYRNAEALWVPGVVPLPHSPLAKKGWGLRLIYFPWKEF